MNDDNKDPVSISDLDDLIRDYGNARDEYAEKKEKSNEAHAKMKALENKVIATLEASDKKKYYSDIGTVSISDRYTVRVPSSIEDKAELFKYISKRYGQDVLISKSTMNHQTLNSFYKAEMKKAKDSGESDFHVPGLEEPVLTQVLSLRAK